MADLTLVWNPATGTADLAMCGPSLKTGNDLETAIILPVNTNSDPRGWWGDAYNAPDQIGSKLWQIFNRIRNQQTLNDARDFATKALQWLIDDGLAVSVSVSPRFYGSAGIALSITITSLSGVVNQYSYAWGGIN